jgi:hypothetical protein
VAARLQGGHEGTGWRLEAYAQVQAERSSGSAGHVVGPFHAMDGQRCACLLALAGIHGRALFAVA